MAIPTNHIDKITDHDSGESRHICPPADHVSVDNENYEGETLDEVLDEVSRAIEEAGQGGYAPPDGGIPKTDLAQDVQDSLDKADSALQEEDLADYATKTELQQGLGGKQDTINDLASIRTGAAAGATAYQKPASGIPASDIASGVIPSLPQNIVQSVTINSGNPVTPDNNGNVNIVVPSGGLTESDISVETQGDGTVDINVGSDTYTIDLNHEHPDYQPLLTSANAGTNITITTDPQTGEVTISATGGGGGTQVQADWNQTDSTAVDFIKNKPTIPVVPTAVSAFTNDAGYLTKHQSLAGRVQSQDVVSIVKISQSAYDALQAKDSTTLYLITES